MNTFKEVMRYSEYINLYCEEFNKDKNNIQDSLIEKEYELTNSKIVWSQNDLNFMNYEIKELLLPHTKT